MADTESITERMQRLAELKRRRSGAADPEPAPAKAPETAAQDIDHEEFDAVFGGGTRSEPKDAAPAHEDTHEDTVAPVSEDSHPPELTTQETDEDVEVIALGTADTYAADSDAPAPELHVDTDSDAAEPAAKVEMDQDDIESLTAYFASLGISPDSPDDASAPDPVQDNPAPEAAQDTPDPIAEEPVETETAETEIPDFSKSEVDPEILAREFDHEADRPVAQHDATDGRLSITFDESRTTLLNHVSRQMNCSVEDVVVTALDWYLDALFGEEEDAQATG